MWVYLLKFSACLALLLLFYKLVLETTHLHHFKRYFLLSAFILSLSIPLITFTQYITVSVETTPYTPIADHGWSDHGPNPALETNILPIILWTIYALGSVLLTIKFLANLSSLIKSIRNNPKRKSGTFHHVLLQELIAPHTFFSYIFFNRKNYEDQKIPQEVVWHEETHAKQKHSLDILLLELLHIVFWFHPLVYWTKHLVKLNHEFLADQAVLNKGASVSDYQNMILTFSSSNSYQNVPPSLTNAIHYLSIKKRIVVINTKTSKKAILSRTFLLLPLLALMLLSFSTKEIKKVEKTAIKNVFQNTTSMKVFQDTATAEMVKEYNDLIILKNKLPEHLRIYKQIEVDRLQYIYGLMTEYQKQTAEIFPVFPAPIPVPTQISKEEEQRSMPPISPRTEKNIEIEEVEKKVQEENPMTEKVRSVKKIDSIIRLDIPPPPPTIATHVNTQNYSKTLKKAIDRYLKESKSYRAAVSSYHTDNNGSTDALEKTYIEVMQSYNEYKELALEENVFMQPVPLYSDPKGEFGDQNSRLRGTQTDIPSPSIEGNTNQKAKLINPLDFSEKIEEFKILTIPARIYATRYLKDKKHEGAEIYFHGMKIDHGKAIKLLESDKAVISDIWKIDEKKIIKLVALP